MWGGDDELSDEYEDEFEYGEGVGDGDAEDQEVLQKQIVNIKNTVNVAVNNYVKTVNSGRKNFATRVQEVTTEGVEDGKSESVIKELSSKLEEVMTEGVKGLKDASEYVSGANVSEPNNQMVKLMEKGKNVSLAVHEQICEDKDESTSVYIQIVLVLGGIVIGVIISIMVYIGMKYYRLVHIKVGM